jgi:hypothetical protein
MNKLIISLLILLISCNNSEDINNSRQIIANPIDTSNAIKVGTFWIMPKPSLEFNAIHKINKDTFNIVICSDFSFYPFGKLTDTSGVKLTELKKFVKTDTLIKFPNDHKLLCHELNYKDNNLLLWFDKDTESSTHSYILHGEINDSEIELVNAVKIGMSKEDFVSIFFENFPKVLIERYHVFIFETCVTGLTHQYIFKNNKLKSIHFMPTPIL